MPLLAWILIATIRRVMNHTSNELSKKFCNSLVHKSIPLMSVCRRSKERIVTAIVIPSPNHDCRESEGISIAFAIRSVDPSYNLQDSRGIAECAINPTIRNLYCAQPCFFRVALSMLLLYGVLLWYQAPDHLWLQSARESPHHHPTLATS